LARGQIGKTPSQQTLRNDAEELASHEISDCPDPGVYSQRPTHVFDEPQDSFDLAMLLEYAVRLAYKGRTTVKFS
jgi:hypothetical protein